ncbi:MAG: STAS domain-containing protein [Eubacterium sp.]|nr:STAS domain-containing protein [Eubacterium sp.]
MTINKNKNGDELVYSLEGTLDTTTAPDLQKDLDESMGDVRSIVFDFTDITYISSAGLRVLLHAHKFMNNKGGVKIININDIVQEVFEVTGFIDILNIE